MLFVIDVVLTILTLQVAGRCEFVVWFWIVIAAVSNKIFQDQSLR